MSYTNTTPVPNALFDIYLSELQSAELKVLLIVIRQTLGWSDRRTQLGRKERDWISNSQLQAKTGASRRAISSAIEVLVSKGIIEVLDEYGNLLLLPSLRKGKQRLYYRASPHIISGGDTVGKRSEYNPTINPANATIALGLRKEVSALVQKLHITKETLLN